MIRATRNTETPVGLHALISELDLKIPRPIVRSIVTGGTRKTRITDAEVLEQYPKPYQPAAGPVGQLRFALRYEPVELSVYQAAFARIPKIDIERWVQSEPNGIFARRAWYLYELLTGETLDVPDLTSGPYVDILDSDLHIAGPVTRIRRQRVFDNLLGNQHYCPLIRRTEKLAAGIAKNLTERARALPSLTTRAETGTAPSVRATPACAGSRRGSGSYFPPVTCTSSLPCRGNWLRSPCRING